MTSDKMAMYMETLREGKEILIEPYSFSSFIKLFDSTATEEEKQQYQQEMIETGDETFPSFHQVKLVEQRGA